LARYGSLLLTASGSDEPSANLLDAV
jgi:hypothetical protein